MGSCWAAVSGIWNGGSITAVVLAVLVSQILIFAGTAFSYMAGVDTFFNFPEALNQGAAIGFGAAMGARTITFVVNCIIGAISAAIGWALGGLLPRSR